MRWVIIGLWIWTGYYCNAQSYPITSGQVQVSLGKFYEFLSLPNDAHRPEDLETNIRWLEKEWSARGFSVQRLTNKGIDLLLAHKIYNPSWPTLLFYLQVDGQPVDPAKWNQSSPWIPVLKEKTETGWVEIDWARLEQPNREWRIFARSVSDAKGPILALLTAYDVLIAGGQQTNYNIKIIHDSEEELGSPNITNAVERYKDLLKADAMIILDGPLHPSNKPTLAFGARGIISFSLTAYGPNSNLHSGHYGNYVPNPVFTLSRLLSSMKDARGRVKIKGFYDGIRLDRKTRATLANTPDDLPALHQAIGIRHAESVGHNLQEAIQYPSLNIDGIRAGYVGSQARTIIPDLATAAMDIRLVKETTGERMIRLLKQHIISQGFTLLDHEPSAAERQQHDHIISLQYQLSYEAFRTEMDAPVGLFLKRALSNSFNQAPVLIRTHGGSIPISPFVVKLGIPAVAVPIVNYDNNQHSENENIRLGNYLDGIRSYYYVLSTPYDHGSKK